MCVLTVHRDQLGLDINSNSYYNNNMKHCQGVLSQGEGKEGGGASLCKTNVENARLYGCSSRTITHFGRISQPWHRKEPMPNQRALDILYELVFSVPSALSSHS